MRMWDFTDSTFVIFFCITVIAALLIVGFVISFIISKNLDFKRQDEIRNESTTIRIYIIDLKNNNVIYFNRSRLQDKKRMSLSKFYLRFDQNQVDKLKNWIYAICIDNRQMNDYLEIDMVSKKGKNSFYSILKNIKFDSKVGLLHLESHVMRYIVPSSDNKKKKAFAGLVSKEQMKEYIETQKNVGGYTFCARFYYRSQTSNQDRVEKITIATLKNIVYSFAQKNYHPRQIIDEPGNEIFLFDFNLSDTEKAIKLVSNMIHEIAKTIGIKGLENIVKFAIGIVKNIQYYQDFNAIINTSQQACIYAEQHDMPSYFYTRSNKLVLSETGKYSQEITRLLKPNSMHFYFRAVVDANKGKTIGYFNYITAPESPFTNFVEMSKYSAKVHRNKEFFAFVSKNVISRYNNEKRDNATLFIPVSSTDLSFMYEVLSQNNALKECHVALVFAERDFEEEETDLASVSLTFEHLRKIGLKFALNLHDQNLLLDPLIYSQFDYFIIGSPMIKEIRKSKFTRLSIHTLVEQLLKYKKPIIASGIESWQSVELIVSSGITLVSSEVISPTNAMVLPLEKRRIDKLVGIANHYR